MALQAAEQGGPGELDDVRELAAVGPWGGLATDFRAVHPESDSLAAAIAALPPPSQQPPAAGTRRAGARRTPRGGPKKWSESQALYTHPRPLGGSYTSRGFAGTDTRGFSNTARSARSRGLEPGAVEVLATLPPRLQAAYLTMRAQAGSRGTLSAR